MKKKLLRFECVINVVKILKRSMLSEGSVFHKCETRKTSHYLRMCFFFFLNRCVNEKYNVLFNSNKMTVHRAYIYGRSGFHSVMCANE